MSTHESFIYKLTKIDFMLEYDKNKIIPKNNKLFLRIKSYSRRDLNPHEHYCSLDFKSNVSTNSTTRAKKRAKDGI